MKRAARLARHYIRANDLRAVYLAASSARGRATRIGITRAPADRARTMRGWTIVGVWWCTSSRDAARLIAQVATECPGIDRKPFSIRRVPDVAQLIATLARDAGIPIAGDEQVQRRAAAVVADLAQRIDAQQTAGQLRALNADYKRRRKEEAARGRSFMSYGDYLERYQIRRLYEIAAAVKDC